MMDATETSGNTVTIRFVVPETPKRRFAAHWFEGREWVSAVELVRAGILSRAPASPPPEEPDP